jgi:hypothetical protein
MSKSYWLYPVLKKLNFFYLLLKIFSILTILWYILYYFMSIKEELIKPFQFLIPRYVVALVDFFILFTNIFNLLLIFWLLKYKNIYTPEWIDLETRTFTKYSLGKERDINKFHLKFLTKVLFISYAVSTVTIFCTCMVILFSKNPMTWNFWPLINNVAIVLRMIFSGRNFKLVRCMYKNALSF